MRDVDAHQGANQTYIEEGLKLLELAHRAHRLFQSQPPPEKRKLLDFVLWNCSWMEGELTAEYRKPFDLLTITVATDRKANGGGGAETGNFDNWRRERDSNPR